MIMQVSALLVKRSDGKCELCSSANGCSPYEVAYAPHADADGTIFICSTCLAQIDKKEELNTTHWRCLESIMWSEVTGLKVTAWRMLNRLKYHSWASDQLDMLYLEDDMLAWAKSAGDHENDAAVVLHRDSNGHVLKHGDAVVLTKSLDVKGSTLNARMGTVVRNIRLVADNTDQIEGRIEGQQIVILTQYVRRQNS
jgi:protein PhnA